jgi:glucose-6-phosphate isomerase, archaeal
LTTELLHPFTVTMDLARGELDPSHQVTERRLSDMEGMYLQGGEGLRDRLVYRVQAIRVPETGSNIACSTTVLEPGTVGREYFMTKGHFHNKRERAEVYVGLAGRGVLVMATEDGRWITEPQYPGSVNYVPGGWAHRSVNVGEEPLVFFAAYVGDAGHDYLTIEKRGFPVVVLQGHEGPEVVPNARFGRK